MMSTQKFSSMIFVLDNQIFILFNPLNMILGNTNFHLDVVRLPSKFNGARGVMEGSSCDGGRLREKRYFWLRCPDFICMTREWDHN